MKSGSAARVAMLLSNPFRPDPRVLKEAESLAGAGFEMTVICWDRQRELPESERLASGVRLRRVQEVPSAYGAGLRQILRLPAYWRAAWRLLDEIRPALVHCHDFDTLPAGLWWGRRHRIPVIYDAHEYYADLVSPRLPGWSGGLLVAMIRQAELWAAGRANAVVTVDDTLGDIYRRRNRRVLIVGHYPSSQLFPQPSTPFSGMFLNLLYAGRLSMDRGLGYYASLLRMLIDRGIPARLHLAGSYLPASEQESLKECAVGLDEHVIDHGWVTYDRLPNLLRSADVGLSVLMPEPRYIAALPVKLFEYMAAGLPVVASNFPPIANVVKTAQCGLLVDPTGAPGVVANELVSWWRDPQYPRELGANGRRAVLDRYNWESLAESLVSLYHELTG